MKQGTDFAIMPFDQVAGWDSFVDRHPKGTIFHCTAMIRTMAKTKRHQPFAYAAVNKNGEICSMLVAVKVSTLGKWADAFAARSIFYAEPIYIDGAEGLAGMRLLLIKHDTYMRQRTLFAEVRPFYSPPAIDDPLVEQKYGFLGYLNYELDLGKFEEKLFSDLDAKCRNNIRTTMRRGLTVREANPSSELSSFYALVAESYSKSKVPLADRSLFEAAIREMPSPICRLFFADYQNKVAAAACFLAYKKRVVYWYAGAKRIPGIAAMSCLLWEAITKYSMEGYEVFDFAGAGWEGESYGPGRFKAKFGGVQTNYGRYRRIYAPWKLQCASSVYQALRGWLSPRSENR